MRFLFLQEGVTFVEDKAESDQPPREVGITDKIVCEMCMICERNVARVA